MIVETERATVVRSRFQSPSLRAYAALALGAVCIGFSAIFTKWASVDQPVDGPVSAFYRVGIATAVLALPYGMYLARHRGGMPQAESEGERARHASPLQVVGVTALSGLFLALDLGVWNTSLLYTSAANSTLLGNTSTLWVALGAMLLFHERLRRRFWLGMLLAMVGVVIVVGRDVVAHPTTLGWGDLLATATGLFYAGYLLSTQAARKYVSTLPFMWQSSLVTTLFLLGFVWVLGQRLTGYSTNTYMSLVALALVSHVLGWFAINYSLGQLPASITSVTLLSQPVLTALFAVPLLGEGLSPYQIGGGLLVLLGIYIVNRR